MAATHPPLLVLPPYRQRKSAQTPQSLHIIPIVLGLQLRGGELGRGDLCNRIGGMAGSSRGSSRGGGVTTYCHSSELGHLSNLGRIQFFLGPYR